MRGGSEGATNWLHPCYEPRLLFRLLPILFNSTYKWIKFVIIQERKDANPHAREAN